MNDELFTIERSPALAGAYDKLLEAQQKYRDDFDKHRRLKSIGFGGEPWLLEDDGKLVAEAGVQVIWGSKVSQSIDCMRVPHAYGSTQIVLNEESRSFDCWPELIAVCYRGSRGSDWIRRIDKKHHVYIEVQIEGIDPEKPVLKLELPPARNFAEIALKHPGTFPPYLADQYTEAWLFIEPVHKQISASLSLPKRAAFVLRSLAYEGKKYVDKEYLLIDQWTYFHPEDKAEI